jgi:rubrerythrin
MATSKQRGTSSKGRPTDRTEPPEERSASGEGGSSTSAEAGSDSEEEIGAFEDEFEDVEPEIQALIALIQMDSEAATAYEMAAEVIGIPEIQSHLIEFAADHDRHVEELGDIVRQRGFERESGEPDPEGSTFAVFSAALGSVSAQGALLALVASEQFTNSAYETAMEVVDDPDARRVIERNFADEQRHLKWLVANKDRPWEEAESAGAEHA